MKNEKTPDFRVESDSPGELRLLKDALHGIHTERAIKNFPLSGRPVNRALVLPGSAPGNSSEISPLDEVNLHRSTNDTYPTALLIAAIRGVRMLKRSSPTSSNWGAPSIREITIDDRYLSQEDYDMLLTSEAVRRLGS